MNELIDKAKKFLQQADEAQTKNRADALDDLKFSSGFQWPVEVQNSRNLEARPCLTINKLDAYIRQICNQQRQSRPRIKVHGMNGASDAKIAEILTGICRHIEVNSDADTAYDTAFEYAVRMGWGFMRLTTKYVREDSFDQEIYIEPIDNPFSVYYDPNSTLPDGSDCEGAMITEFISKKKFRSMYPNADDGGNFNPTGTGDYGSEWVTKEDIRIAEWFYTDRQKTKLVLLSDGTTAYKEDLPAPELLMAAGIQVISERDTIRKKIKWCKLTGLEVLEETEWPGRFIPIIPVYGHQLVVDGKRKVYGLVREAKDAQRMFNYWQTAITETVALAPKAKWLLAEGQDEGFENDWAQANIKSLPVLRYKQTDIQGNQAPMPQRIQPEPPPVGIMAAAESINNDLQAVVGIYDPNQFAQGNLSGKAIRGQQMQIDLTNFNYYDNLTRSLRMVGRQILDLVPKIYDHERVMRIIGYDGQPEMVTINQRVQDDMGVTKILNDVTVGEYDVVMDTGPAYQSKRQEAVESMLPLISANQELFNLAGDLVFRNMDFPGADIIADRLAAVNPLAQIDDKSEIPPQVQMQLQMSQKQIADLQQQIAAMQLEKQYRADVEAMRQEGETKRKLMDVTSRAHNTETMAEVKVNDQNTRSITSQNKTEIEAIVSLLSKRMDLTQLKEEIARREAEQLDAASFAATDVEQGGNPLAS